MESANKISFLKRFKKSLTWQFIAVIFPVFIFIFADVICENHVVSIYSQQSELTNFIFLTFFCFLQIIFAPLQSSLSDIYGRKAGIFIALLFSLISIILIYVFNVIYQDFLFILILATISKGVFGNTLPIALAVIADSKYKNHRMLFIFATAAYAMAYLIFSFMKHSSIFGLFAEHNLSVQIGNFLGMGVFEEKYISALISVILFLFFVAVTVFCLFVKFKKKRQPQLNFLHELKRETSLLKKDLQIPAKKNALIPFFLWEVSLYAILISQIDFASDKSLYLAEFMMLGYLVGVSILIFSYKLSDSTTIKIGYWISFLSLIPYFVLFKILHDQSILLRTCCFFHALGNAFLSPSLLSILANELTEEEHGRIYGLTDSVDTFAYWCGIVIIILVVRLMKLDIFYLMAFSFLVFSYSWKYYNRFQNLQEKKNG